MKNEWLPDLGPLKGAFLFLSASVPDPKREPRFLNGPLNKTLMVRLIDKRVDRAVKSLVAHTLSNGGRIVHGGQKNITGLIASQASNWTVPAGVEVPIRIYQSKFFENKEAPPGREELAQSGVGTIHWVSTDLNKVAAEWNIPPEKIQEWLPQQAPAEAKPELKEALLAMRIEMLLECQPKTAVCIGGMEGIEAEARLYLDLAAMGFIPAATQVHVFGSTFGAAAQLKGDGINFVDESHIDTLRAGTAPDGVHLKRATVQKFSPLGAEDSEETPLGPSEETAKQDMQHPFAYDKINRSLFRDIISRLSR